MAAVVSVNSLVCLAVLMIYSESRSSVPFVFSVSSHMPFSPFREITCHAPSSWKFKLVIPFWFLSNARFCRNNRMLKRKLHSSTQDNKKASNPILTEENGKKDNSAIRIFEGLASNLMLRMNISTNIMTYFQQHNHNLRSIQFSKNK